MNFDEQQVKGFVQEIEDEFQETVDAVIHEFYPELMHRVRTANFAGWHRRIGQEEDLAHETCFEFRKHCLRTRRLPEKCLNYVVTIARNTAKRHYSEHMQLSEIVEPLQGDFEAPPDGEGDGETRSILDQVHKERLLAALDRLPDRQREAFELKFGNPDATYRQLADHMGIGEDGFRKNFDRACAALQLILTGR